jgi:hypothetical protein
MCVACWIFYYSIECAGCLLVPSDISVFCQSVSVRLYHGKNLPRPSVFSFHSASTNWSLRGCPLDKLYTPSIVVSGRFPYSAYKPLWLMSRCLFPSPISTGLNLFRRLRTSTTQHYRLDQSFPHLWPQNHVQVCLEDMGIPVHLVKLYHAPPLHPHHTYLGPLQYP